MQMLNHIHNEIASFNLFQMGLFWLEKKMALYRRCFWIECIPVYMFICYLSAVFAKAFMLNSEKNEIDAIKSEKGLLQRINNEKINKDYLY